MDRKLDSSLGYQRCRAWISLLLTIMVIGTWWLLIPDDTKLTKPHGFGHRFSGSRIIGRILQMQSVPRLCDSPFLLHCFSCNITKRTRQKSMTIALSCHECLAFCWYIHSRTERTVLNWLDRPHGSMWSKFVVKNNDNNVPFKTSRDSRDDQTFEEALEER